MGDDKTPFFKTVEDNIEHTLLEARRIFFCESVDSNSARDAIRKLWYLELKDPGKPILFIINSPGGSVDAGYAIWDQVKMISSPVVTLVTGLAASMGSILSLCAAPDQRFATPNARIMIHQPSIHGVIQGQATDLDIQAREIIKTRDALIKIYMDATGKNYDEIKQALDRDSWMSAQECLEFGLLSKIVTKFEELPFK
ncbi:ATP-dependent Clp protease proteolytic subunit 1 [Chlamydiales bacterium SCGC AG-110-M15]|nr:ATP-dependent Clp protease proteolytic subunit 1 [Chlamydiales bacterium SCGC AG-110-M15]